MPGMRQGIGQGVGQVTGTRQEIGANPRLYQAMEMLYMPLPELQARLEEELSENPFLELSEPDDYETGEDEAATDAEEEGEREEGEEEIDWEEVLRDNFDAGSARESYEQREEFEAPVVEVQHLQDHLLEQVALLPLDDRERWIAEEIVGNIDDDGYLSCSLQVVADGLNAAGTDAFEMAMGRAHAIEDEDARAAELAELARLFAPHTPEEVEEMLLRVQRLDPAGVGAHSLSECLEIQLRRSGRGDSLAATIVRDHFEDLGGHRWTEIARILEVEPRAVQDAADEIGTLDPKPGSHYSGEPERYVIPDLILERIHGEYMVFVNDTGLPRLRLARAYREVAADRAKFVGENREFISNKLNAAHWLIQVIEQRRQTMLGVMRFIVDRQTDFFEKGVQHMKPLTLREVADHIEMAESTVSRVTNEKYVQTPTGVYPLKFFFSGGIRTATGDELSTRGVQAKVKSLVEREDPHKPLTDAAMVRLLRAEGIPIARRTIAKYRDQLGILPARMRKRLQ